MTKLETLPFQDAMDGIPGRYWHGLADGRIQCDRCPRYCKLHDGQRGLCFVRARRGNEIRLTTYGRSSGFCIDPIEKKPLNHFLPGTPVLSFGAAGCNLTCKFCQNWDNSKAHSLDRLQSEAAPETIVHAAQETASRAIAYTYNDPVIFLEYAVDVAKAAREQGIKNVAVTAGYISEKAREEFFSVMDAAHACGKSVIGRNWYEITSWALDETGCCRSCGAQCPGVFEQRPGTWGAQRMPIALGGGERALG